MRFLPPERNEQIEDQDGVNITKLKPGTKLEVQTQSGSVYKITVLNPGKRRVEIQGGRHFEQPEEVFLMGSTWGGSMIKLGWIGHNMCMEAYRQQHFGPLVTTGVKALKIIGLDWEYNFEWENKNGKIEAS